MLPLPTAWCPLPPPTSHLFHLPHHLEARQIHFERVGDDQARAEYDGQGLAKAIEAGGVRAPRRERLDEGDVEQRRVRVHELFRGWRKEENARRGQRGGQGVCVCERESAETTNAKARESCPHFQRVMWALMVSHAMLTSSHRQASSTPRAFHVSCLSGLHHDESCRLVLSGTGRGNMLLTYVLLLVSSGYIQARAFKLCGRGRVRPRLSIKEGPRLLPGAADAKKKCNSVLYFLVGQTPYHRPANKWVGANSGTKKKIPAKVFLWCC